MNRANVYALLVITAVFLLFCFASVIANAQEAGNDETSVTHLGERIDELYARVDMIDERITGTEDADQQDELWDTVNNLDRLVGDLDRELLSFRDMSDRLACSNGESQRRPTVYPGLRGQSPALAAEIRFRTTGHWLSVKAM